MHPCPVLSGWRGLRRPSASHSAEKRTLDLITDHPMIPREHLATWLGVSEGRVSQMMRSLVDTWGLVERRGKRGDARYTLSAEGIRYVTHRDRAQLPTTQGIWSTALTTDKQGRRRHVGHRIETWATPDEARRRHHVVPVEAGSGNPCRPRQRAWCGPSPPPGQTAPTTGGSRPSPPTPWEQMTAEGLGIPFYFEYELRARHPKGVLARLRPYAHYYHSNEPGEDQPPYPFTLFVVDTEAVEAHLREHRS